VKPKDNGEFVKGGNILFHGSVNKTEDQLRDLLRDLPVPAEVRTRMSAEEFVEIGVRLVGWMSAAQFFWPDNTIGGINVLLGTALETVKLQKRRIEELEKQLAAKS
jgi:hypothetical protein